MNKKNHHPHAESESELTKQFKIGFVLNFIGCLIIAVAATVIILLLLDILK